MLAEAEARVEPLFDDILEAVVGAQLQLDLGIGQQEGAEARHDDLLRGDQRHGDPQRTGGATLPVGKRLHDIADVGQRRSQRIEQQPALLGRRDGAGGAGEEPHAEARLERRDGMADGRRRDGEFGRRLAEGTRLRNDGKHGELGKLGAVHCSNR